MLDEQYGYMHTTQMSLNHQVNVFNVFNHQSEGQEEGEGRERGSPGNRGPPFLFVYEGGERRVARVFKMRLGFPS